MKVIIVGLPYFAKEIARQLGNVYTEDRFIKLDTYYSHFDKLKFLFHIFTADSVHSINGTITKSLPLKLALKFKKKVIMHWVGTDLFNAIKSYQEGNYDNNFIQKPTHLTDTPWFVDKLKEIGINNASFIPLKAIEKSTIIENFPEKFKVLAYIPENRAEFYGIETAIAIANATPDIDYMWVGIEKWKSELPKNIKLLGWVSDIKPAINESVACIRMPKTDGLSFFILEAIALQRYTAYNQPFHSSKYCKTTDDFVEYLMELKRKFDKDELDLNEINSDEILESFNFNKVVKNIYSQYNP